MSNSPPGAMQLLIWLAVVAGFVVVMTITILVLRRGSVAGPDRLAEGEPAGTLVGITLLALGLWVLIPSMYAASLEARQTAATTAPATQRQRVELTPAQTVGLSLFAATIVSAVLVGGNVTLRPGGLRALGLGPGALPRGLLIGLGAALLIVPLAFLAGVLTDAFWRLVNYEHSGMHEMLEILGTTRDPTLRIQIYISAAIGAPVFEELLFRGHVQTVLVHFLRTMLRPAPVPLVAGQSLDPADPVLPYATPAPPANTAPAAARWAAIVLTSALFTLVHGALWMMPPIFFLSLCLGYVYERTGNLWAAIVVHMLFNALNVTFFVYLVMR